MLAVKAINSNSVLYKKRKSTFFSKPKIVLSNICLQFLSRTHALLDYSIHLTDNSPCGLERGPPLIGRAPADAQRHSSLLPTLLPSSAASAAVILRD